MSDNADVVVIGGGAVGAACAYFATLAGLSVRVLDRGPIAGGSSSAGEGNLLVSDKEVGPELDLARYARQVWQTDLAEYGSLWEFSAKGGLVVAASQTGAAVLRARTDRQRTAGIEVEDVAADDLTELEPHLSPELHAGALYHQDAQVQPVLLTAHLLKLARQQGAVVSTRTEVTGLRRAGERVVGVMTAHGPVEAGAVINAAGVNLAQIAELAGVTVPITPRRGFILVTEPLPPMIRHKVYASDYVANVLSSEEALHTSPVVEGTESGTILIGSSRERVGLDQRSSLAVLARLARDAARLFPALRPVMIMRSYLGFRPYCPDHLPVIGHDPLAPGLWHAGGHEGAGIGLSAATGKLLIQAITRQPLDLDLHPFRPDRFTADG